MKRCAECRRVYDRDVRVCEVDGTLLDDFSSDPLVAQTIAKRYRLIRRLGTGPLGRVYLAAELRTGKAVAVKLLGREYRCDDDVLKQCLWDARFATASSPAHVARVYEVGRTDEGQIFVAMEYVDGESLADLIQRAGPLEPERALRLADQIAQAVTAAARVGVAHRDIKPQNVMVDGAEDRVKVTDFGVAWLRARGVRGSPARFGGDAPKYAAPEQWRGEDADDRTDIYGIGAVLYAMLTGAAPPARRHDAGGRDAGWVAPPPVTSRRPELPGALEDALVRALAREPDRRYDSIGEFAATLHDLSGALAEGQALEGARAPAAASPRVVIEPVSEPSYLAPWRSWLEWWQPHHEQWRAHLARQQSQLRLHRLQWQATVRARWQSGLRVSRTHVTGVTGAVAQTAAGASRAALGAVRTATVGAATSVSRVAFVASATTSRVVERASGAVSGSVASLSGATLSVAGSVSAATVATSRTARLASRAMARSGAEAGRAATLASVRAWQSVARAAVDLSYGSAGFASATATHAVTVSARVAFVVSTIATRSAVALSQGLVGATRRVQRSVGRGAGTITGAVAAGTRIVSAVSRVTVSRLANTSRTVAHGAAAISRAATNATTAAIAGTAGAIASATVTTTNVARVGSRSARPHVERGLQTLAISVTGVSRATVFGIANTSRVAAHAAATTSRAATNAATTAIAGTAAAIASAAAAATNAAHVTRRNARSHVDRGLRALATSVTAASRAAVSQIANISCVAAHSAATLSRTATNATTAAMAGAIGAIASAAAATTNAVRVASRNARPHVDRGLQALAGSVTGASRPVVKAAGIAAGASARASRGVMTRATSGAAAASRAALIATQNAARDAATASRAGAVVAGSGYRAAATVVTITAAGAATAVSRTIPAGSRALRRVVDGSGVVVAASRRGDQALHWARARGRRLALTSATALVVVGAALVVTGAITWGVVGRHRGDAAEGPSVVSRVVVAHPEIARERGGLERSSRASSTPRPAGRALARADNVAEPHTVTAVTTADRREEIGAVPRSESIARIPSETERSVEVPAVRTVVGTDDAARIRLEIQQTLRNRGLLRENAADRWGVAVDVSPSGDVMLEGAVRDVALSQEAVRRAQDVAKTRHVTHNIRVIAAGDAP